VEKSIRVQSGLARQLFSSLSKNDGVYQQHGFVGKSLLRLRPKDAKSNQPVVAPDSDAYDKWDLALSSPVDLVAETNSRYCLRIRTRIIPLVPDMRNNLWTGQNFSAKPNR